MTVTLKIDPVELTRALIRCPSITPLEGGALDLLEGVLRDLGFTCQRLKFSQEGSPEVENLYARLGESGRNFCYAGHTDVVPPGDPADWRVEPFAAEISGDDLIGRGAVDMKGSIGAFTAAVADFLKGRISIAGSRTSATVLVPKSDKRRK